MTILRTILLAACLAPNVPRAVIETASGMWPLICPETGLCYRPGPDGHYPAFIRIVCLTPQEHAAARERAP